MRKKLILIGSLVFLLAAVGAVAYFVPEKQKSRAETVPHTPVFSWIKNYKFIYWDVVNDPNEGVDWNWIKTHYDWLKLGNGDNTAEYKQNGGTAPTFVYWEYNSITAFEDYQWFRNRAAQSSSNWEDTFVHFSTNTVHRPAYEDSGSDSSKEDRFDAVYVYNGSAYSDQTTNAYGGNSFTIGGANWITYIGYEEPFKEVNVTLANAASGWSGTWEYWNGSSWVALNPTDGTANMTQNGKVEFIPPLSNWQRNSVNNKELWWIRSRTTNAGSTQPVVAGGGLKGRNFITFASPYYIQPGWDPANDTNGDGYAELNNNPNANARFRYEARVHYYEFRTTYLNMGSSNIQTAIGQRANEILTTPIKAGFSYTYDSMFLDNASATLYLHNRQSGGSTVENTSDATYQANSIASIRAIKTANPDKIIFLNTSVYVGSPYEEYIDAADGYHGESYIRVDGTYTKAQIDAVINRDTKGKWGQVTSQGVAAVEGDLERDRIFSLATFYLSKGPNTYYTFGAHGLGPVGGRTLKEQFYPAIEYNVGQPKASYYILHQEDDPSCPHNEWGIAKMYAREFDKALMVSLPLPHWDSNYTASYTVSLPSYDKGGGQTSNRYQKLNSDGTINPNIITSITLRNAEGAILVKTDVAGGLTIQKSVDKTQVVSGEIITYTINYNVTATANNAKIEDNIPNGTTFLQIISGPGTYDSANNKVIWSLGNKSTGDSGSVSFKVTVN